MVDRDPAARPLGHQPVTAGTTPPRAETAQGVIDYYRKGPGAEQENRTLPTSVTV
jgi:hypothetical protein